MSEGIKRTAGATTYVCVVQCGCEDPVEKYKSGHDVHLSPPWDHQWAIDPSNLVPIESQYAHTQPRVYTKQLVDRYIIWGDPTDEGEYG